MPYYSIFKSSKDMFIDEIDDKEVYDFLQKFFVDSQNLKDEVKDLIKNEKKMNRFLAETKFLPEEFIGSVARLFPDIWNHHLVKYVRKNYLDKPVKERKKKEPKKKSKK